MTTRAGTFTNLDMAAFDDEAFAMDEGATLSEPTCDPVGPNRQMPVTIYRRATKQATNRLSGTLFLYVRPTQSMRRMK